MATHLFCELEAGQKFRVHRETYVKIVSPTHKINYYHIDNPRLGQGGMVNAAHNITGELFCFEGGLAVSAVE